MDYKNPPPGAPPLYGEHQGQVIATRISPAVMLELIARGVAILLTFLAGVVIGTSEEFGVKFSSYSAFRYFLVANILVLIYSIASLLMSIIIKSKSIILRISNTIVDLVAVSLLLTANGAASAIIAQFDNIDKFDRKSSCSYLSKFCSHVKGSIAISMLAVGLYLALIILTLMNFASKRN